VRADTTACGGAPRPLLALSGHSTSACELSGIMVAHTHSGLSEEVATPSTAAWDPFASLYEDQHAHYPFWRWRQSSANLSPVFPWFAGKYRVFAEFRPLERRYPGPL